MAARIKDKYSPEDDGSLYGTIAEAEAALQAEDEGGRLYGVSDEEGTPVAIYYVE